MPIFGGFRYAEGLAIFENRLKVIPQAAADLKGIGQERTMWLDNILADGRKFLCGDRMSCADLVGCLCFSCLCLLAHIIRLFTVAQRRPQLRCRGRTGHQPRGQEGPRSPRHDRRHGVCQEHPRHGGLSGYRGRGIGTADRWTV